MERRKNHLMKMRGTVLIVDLQCKLAKSIFHSYYVIIIPKIKIKIRKINICLCFLTIYLICSQQVYTLTKPTLYKTIYLNVSEKNDTNIPVTKIPVQFVLKNVRDFVHLSGKSYQMIMGNYINQKKLCSFHIAIRQLFY